MGIGRHFLGLLGAQLIQHEFHRIGNFGLVSGVILAGAGMDAQNPRRFFLREVEVFEALTIFE